MGAFFKTAAASAVLAVALLACRAKEAAPVPAVEAPAGLVKSANVAGTFYPRDADELKAVVRGDLGRAEKKLAAEDVVAVFTPHAGYEFSAAVAATAYRQVEGREPATVVIIAPSHHFAAGDVAAPTYDGFETPLGTTAVDATFVAEVERRCKRVRFANEPFDPEHAVEVQLPFIQLLFPGAKVAPFIFCRHDAETAAAFGGALAAAAAAQGGDVLLVVTCDLSHYHPYAEAARLDRAFVAAFERFDAAAIYDGEKSGDFEIDAPGPVAAAFDAARAMGATAAVPLEYKNSGDVTGDKSAGVVGYFAGALVRKGPAP